MKRIVMFEVPIDDKPHEVPMGPPVLFVPPRGDRTTVTPVMWAWFEVHVPGLDWDPEEYVPRMQQVQIVKPGQGVPDGWRWLASGQDEHGPAHLYEVRP